MKKLEKFVSHVAHANLMEEIVGSFVFMIAMATPEDSNFEQLNNLNLNEILNKADSFFINHTDSLGIINVVESNLLLLLEQFLKKYSRITDVQSIQQNICWRLIAIEKYLS